MDDIANCSGFRKQTWSANVAHGLSAHFDNLLSLKKFSVNAEHRLPYLSIEISVQW